MTQGPQHPTNSPWLWVWISTLPNSDKDFWAKGSLEGVAQTTERYQIGPKKLVLEHNTIGGMTQHRRWTGKRGGGGRCFGNGLSMLKPLTPMGDRVREMRGGVLPPPPTFPNPGFSFSSFLMEWGKKGSREDWFRIKNVSRKIRKKDFFSLRRKERNK